MYIRPTIDMDIFAPNFVVAFDFLRTIGRTHGHDRLMILSSNKMVFILKYAFLLLFKCLFCPYPFCFYLM